MTYQELYNAVKENKISSAITKEGVKERFFISSSNNLCAFFPRSSRRGRVIYYNDVPSYISFLPPAPEKTQEQKLKSEYNILAKYKRMANEATFTNSWIEDCKRIPDFETWKKDLIVQEYGKPCEPRTKSLYELHITTGNKIDGKVISLDRIAKEYPRAIERLRECILNKIEDQSILSRGKFAGYDITISTATRNGEFMGYLSLEYAGCGNGYYYLLINDNNFIGYDVD